MIKSGVLCGTMGEVVAGWLAARSIARGLRPPVVDHGALRVDTESPGELRRYVFAAPAPEIGELAAAISAPRIFIKMCGHAEQLLELVTPRWRLQGGAWLMVQEVVSNARAEVPAGYRLELSATDGVSFARVVGPHGETAASGYAAEHGSTFIFDRIVTQEAHQRRGLGRALMAALGSTQRSDTARRVLVATEAGRALYSALGWTVLSPYSTVVIPE